LVDSTSIDDRLKEQFWVILVDNLGRVMGTHLVYLSTGQAILVSPGEVFRPAVHEGASAIIIGHNHPAGGAQPSADDIEMQGTMKAAGEILNIPVLDNIIVYGDEHYSMEDNNG